MHSIRSPYPFLPLFCVIIASLLTSPAILAAPQYEIAQPVVVNVAGQTIQLPAGKTVSIMGNVTADGNVMVRFTLPNGSLSMALISVKSLRQKSAAPPPPPVVAATPPPTQPSSQPVDTPPPSSQSGTPEAPSAVPAPTPPPVLPAPALGRQGPVDFGPNVLIFDPSMTDIQQRVDKIADEQRSNQFGASRYALLFKPGKYNLDVRVGYYTQVLGLGQLPDGVTIKGALNSTDRGNVTQTFWRCIENIAIEPVANKGNCYWAVSQGTELRRFHVKGNLWLFSGAGGQEWASGGFLADSHIDGKVVPGSQQQWFSRNAESVNWGGGVWNMVYVGVPGAPKKWPSNTVVDLTPLIAEKPFLFLDTSGNYSVMVPSVVTDSKGSSWMKSPTPGRALPISQFYIAHAGVDNAAKINAALSSGRNLILTPGIYNLETSIQVTRPDTVVLGLGYPTLIPTGGTPALKVADVNGVRIGGLLLEASTTNSPTLLQIGDPGSNLSHAGDPIFLYDIFARVGGPAPGSADCMVTIHSSNVVGDNAWLWRADHGSGVGWTVNKNKNGLIVNGNNVIYYGLAIEHTQEYQMIWNGNGGRNYFYQSEMPYDVPDQASWQHGNAKGYASYKIGDSVTTYEAWGVGIYCYFTAGVAVSDNAIEAPKASGVKIHHMVDVHLGAKGGISHFVNGAGPSVMDKGGGGFQSVNMNEWP